MHAATPITRRRFVRKSAGAIATFGILPHLKSGSVGPNDKVRIGVMGLGGQGTRLATAFAKRPDAEIVYLCDVDTRRFARAEDAVRAAQGKSPKHVQDFRRILDDKQVDVL